MGGSSAAGLVTSDAGDLLTLCEEAARTAGALLLEAAERPHAGIQSKSTPTDLVSEADLAAERAIFELLAARRPGDRLLGEEGGERPLADAPETDVRWVVDPLDGTINFLFGLPQWSVSVACEDADGTIAGVVYDPPRDELFAARRDGPATRDGEPLVAPERGGLADALVATGFAYDAAVRERQALVAARLLPRVRDLRRLGSAALDLCWTACGRYDAYYERSVKAWDVAAGALICERAGLRLHRLEPIDGMPDGLAVASAALLAPLIELVGP